MTTTIIIAATLVITLFIVCFNMKDVCFCKYTPAVLKKELRQAKKLENRTWIYMIRKDYADIGSFPGFLVILSNQADRGSI